MSSSTDSDAYYTSHSTRPTDFDGSFKILRQPAVIYWLYPNGERCYLQGAVLHVRYYSNSTSNTACLKLSVNVRLKQEKRAPRSGTTLFIYIYPDHIQTLSYHVEALPHSVHLSPKDPVSLQFTMLEPPCLIVPEGDYTAVDEDAQELLDLLYSFASQMSFCIHVGAPKKLPRGKLKDFCELASSETKVQRYNIEYVDPASALRGKVGRIFVPSESSDQDIPPPYSPSADQNVLSTPPANSASNKRRQSQIETESDTESDSKYDTDPIASCPVPHTSKRHRSEAGRHSTSSLCVDKLPMTLPILKEMLQSVIQPMVRQEVEDQLRPIRRKIAELKEDIKNMQDSITDLEKEHAVVSERVDNIEEDDFKDQLAETKDRLDDIQYKYDLWDTEIADSVRTAMKEMVKEGTIWTSTTTTLEVE